MPLFVLLVVMVGRPYPVAYTESQSVCEALAERLNKAAPKAELYRCAPLRRS